MQIHIHHHCSSCEHLGASIMGKLEDIQVELTEVRTNVGDMSTALGNINTRIDGLIVTIQDHRCWEDHGRNEWRKTLHRFSEGEVENGLDPTAAQLVLDELKAIKADQQTQEDTANALANPPA